MLARSIASVLAATAMMAAAGSIAWADDDDFNSKGLRKAVTVDGMRAHQAALQNIATANGGNRASGTPGHELSADYVVGKLPTTYFNVTRQRFDFPYYEELSPPAFERTSPTARAYTTPAEFSTMDYSGSGNVTAALQKTNDIVDPPGPTTSGCEDGDFDDFPAGRIWLIQRGTCTFEEKAQNAVEAGAAAVVIFNQGTPGRTDNFAGTLGRPFAIPVIQTSWAVGKELADLIDAGSVTVRVETHTLSVIRNTVNVIAETKTGRADRVVVAGAHLDSVAEGPGIQDNGSGSAAILEIALQMKKLRIRPRNQVRFIWFGAEESGLLGSEHYVASLTAEQIAKIALNLNFDMIASPNFVRFVYDGDGSDTPVAGPNGSAEIEKAFLKFFQGMRLKTEPTAFDGRSDYGPFILVGIPAGGLFTGAEGIKTAAEATIYGGIAGVAYDPCYHQACDTYFNNNDTVFEQMGDAAADAIQRYAMTRLKIKGTSRAADAAVARVSSKSLLYKGSRLQR